MTSGSEATSASTDMAAASLARLRKVKAELDRASREWGLRPGDEGWVMMQAVVATYEAMIDGGLQIGAEMGARSAHLARLFEDQIAQLRVEVAQCSSKLATLRKGTYEDLVHTMSHEVTSGVRALVKETVQKQFTEDMKRQLLRRRSLTVGHIVAAVAAGVLASVAVPAAWNIGHGWLNEQSAAVEWARQCAASEVSAPNGHHYCRTD